jgi:hypothetical protein
MQRTEEKEHCRHSDGYPISGAASDSFKIRRATVRDADVIAWHRARMFQDMGNVSGDAFEILRTKAQARLKQWIDIGDYIGWLATSADKPETIVGDAGIQLQSILPRPVDTSTIGQGRQGTIIKPNRNGASVGSPACSLKRSLLGPKVSGSTGLYFTLRTKAARFTRG